MAAGNNAEVHRRPEGGVEVMVSAAEIAARIDALATAIAEDLGPDIVIVSILKGSFVFSADLMRALHHHGVHPRIDFLTLASYGAGQESSGNIETVHDITDTVAGETVLLIDDILDSGRTLAFARDLLIGRGAARVAACVLLDKPSRRRFAVEADYVGFATPDVFVVGYGLDYAHFYRELPYIGRFVE